MALEFHSIGLDRIDELWCQHHTTILNDIAGCNSDCNYFSQVSDENTPRRRSSSPATSSPPSVVLEAAPLTPPDAPELPLPLAPKKPNNLRATFMRKKSFQLRQSNAELRKIIKNHRERQSTNTQSGLVTTILEGFTEDYEIPPSSNKPPSVQFRS